MMLKTSNNEFIEVDDVEVERQCKLFQNIADTAGDFSYEFQIDNNSETRSKLGISSTINELNKRIYQINNISLLSDDGAVLYTGYIRVSGTNSDIITASFFSGNNNWFNEMDGDMTDLDFSDMEVNIDETTIPASWSNTTGIVFPVLNSGCMSKRNTNNWKVDDFVPFIYIRDIIKKCFAYSGLKLSGSILDDYRYNHMITSNNNIASSQKITDRIIKVSKVVDQTINTGAYEVVEFEVEDSVGELGLWDNTNYRYVADIRMQVELTLNVSLDAPSIFPYTDFVVCINGDTANPYGQFISRGFPSPQTRTKNFPQIKFGLPSRIVMEAGDYLDIRAQTFGPANIDILSGSLEIRPVKVLRAYAEDLVPDIKQVEFVMGVFKLFNPVITYDQFTKTVNVDFFRDIIRNEEIDLSEYIDPDTVRSDNTELIDDFGKVSNLKYADTDNEVVKSYNKGRVYGYGSGQIESGNDFVEKSKDILESIFVPTPENIKNPLGVTLPVIDFTEYETGQDYPATVISDSGAKISVAAEFGPVAGDLVEIINSDVDSYLGTYSIVSVATPLEFYLSAFIYEADADITIRKVQVKSKGNSDQVLLLGQETTPITEFCGETYITIETTDVFDDPYYAWFYKPAYGKIVDSLRTSLSFGDNVIPENQYTVEQYTLIKDYWISLKPILEDPIKVYVEAYLPKSVYDSITFRNPIRLQTEDFNARFFPNRITGYKGSEKPCTLELIKLP